MQAQIATKPAAVGGAAAPARPVDPIVTVVLRETQIQNGQPVFVGPERPVTYPASRFDRYMKKGSDDRSMFDRMPETIISIDDPRETKKKTK